MANITLTSMYNRVIEQTGISTSQYTTPKFLEDVNILVQDIWSEVVKQKRWNSNWDIWYTDTIALQDEYTKPTLSSSVTWAAYIENLSIIYDDLTYNQTWNKQYIPCNLATEKQIANWEYYLENQPKTSPIYFQRDWSVFIAPEPRTSEVWVNRVKVTWVRNIASWAWDMNTTETDIKLPVSMLETIVVWCVWKASIIKRVDRNEIAWLKQDYLYEKQQSLYKLDDNWTFLLEFPN